MASPSNTCRGWCRSSKRYRCNTRANFRCRARPASAWNSIRRRSTATRRDGGTKASIRVSDWTDGYVAEIGYTFGYCGELNPLRIALPFLNAALTPPPIATACELGFGQGISVNIHAAASPISWHGTDFNPGHAAFAQSLAQAAGSGAQLFDQSFAEFCARPDLPDFDFVALHGV